MDDRALRILDANVNRLREALRTMEDYARFAAGDRGLAADLKGLRHDVSGATADLAEAAVPFRDTPRDVGTSLSTPQEQSRSTLGSVAVAAGKRAGEAMRVVEEVTKLLDPAVSGIVKQLRYRLYDCEKSLTLISRPRDRFAGVGVYVLITEAVCYDDWFSVADAAITGGADCLQLREKDLDAGELLHRARRLSELCRDRGVLFVVNDRPDVAVLSGADGVHVGQNDLPAKEARTMVGPDRIVGLSTHNVDQLHRAWQSGVDYVGVGPVFASSTKPRAIDPGLDYARQAATLSPGPTVAIAGITPDNVSDVWATGVTAVAVTSAVTGAKDPAHVVEKLRRPAVEATVEA